MSERASERARERQRERESVLDGRFEESPVKHDSGDDTEEEEAKWK